VDGGGSNAKWLRTLTDSRAFLLLYDVPAVRCALFMERVMRIDVEWDDLDQDVKALIEVSDVLRTEEQIAREIILDAIDPITASGPRFCFDDREPFDVPIHAHKSISQGLGRKLRQTPKLVEI
jgi:hypothetical protein